ncbi:MAG: (d)CMP kinase [Candidatus Brocadiia bacterium]
MKANRIIITIDGPAGAGKSTIAKLVAKRLRFHYLDTGAIYRAVTWKVINRGVGFKNKKALVRLVKSSRIRFRQTDSGTKVMMDGRNISKRIRTPEVTNQVYHLAEMPAIRKEILAIQRKLAGKGNYVAEGRDVGSVVFPDAMVKFYLDASDSERARRRFMELQLQIEDRSEVDKRSAPDTELTYEQVLKEIKLRDARDKSRKVAPLIKPKGAVVVDTTGMTINQVVHRILYSVSQHPVLGRRKLRYS